jgi:hypothetical protein
VLVYLTELPADLAEADLRLQTGWAAFDLIASVKAVQLSDVDHQNLTQLALASTMATSVAVYLAHYNLPVGAVLAQCCLASRC